jgi:DedD protein
MRSKARRRLIGALALVLAAVIIVPPLFDHAPPVEQPEPIVVPAAPSGLTGVEPPAQDALGGSPTGELASANTPIVSQAPDSGAPNAGSVQLEAPAPATPSTPATREDAQSEASAAAAEAPLSSAPKPAEKPAKPAAPATTPSKRTDDGSVALALLAGKMPDTPAHKPATSSGQGSYVLQVAAYTTEQDANQRRDKLIESGVANTYVERAQSGDKTVYRLRVGPFTSHEAAQASQTRLRALGYQNGLISSK